MNEPFKREVAGKESNRTPTTHSPEKSDGDIVPEKRANKGVSAPAEPQSKATMDLGAILSPARTLDTPPARGAPLSRRSL